MPAVIKGQLAIEAIMTAITLIPQIDLDERVAFELIQALQRRIEAARFAHRDHAIDAIESLGDAAHVLECAADDIREEQQAMEAHA